MRFENETYKCCVSKPVAEEMLDATVLYASILLFQNEDRICTMQHRACCLKAWNMGWLDKGQSPAVYILARTEGHASWLRLHL